MKDILKNYLRNLAKDHLLVFAFGFLILLVVVGTVIINIFWGGFFWLPLAKDNTTIKDYMTLYLSMLSVIATLYASFVVIYAYDAWKDQKNFDTNLAILKAAEENLHHFKKNINKVSLTIIKIYDTYVNENEHYIANSLYREPIESESKHLDDFYMYFEKYIDYNFDDQLMNLLNDYYSLAQEILYFNKNFTKNIYKPIYNIIMPFTSCDKWIDSYIKLSNLNNKNEIDVYYGALTRRYECATFLKSDIYVMSKTIKLVNYNELYKLMNIKYTELNNIIKTKMRA
ncbi:hypothetical protein R4446_00120 [Acinetobacter baumannii]|nr:hypothetical protein [Acinetobacter baumannii]